MPCLLVTTEALLLGLQSLEGPREAGDPGGGAASGLENGHGWGRQGLWAPRGARLPPSAPDDLWAVGRGVCHQGQNHPRSRKLPSRWKRPLSEKSGLEGDAHRMCLSGTGTARSRRRAPPLTSGQRHSTGAAPGSGRAGWPSPEVLQSLGCPPQGEGCGHGAGPSCRQKLAPAFSPGGRVRRSRHAAATSLCPLPSRRASICWPGSARCAATVSRALGQGPQRPGLRLLGRPGGLCPTAVPAPQTLAPGRPLTWNVPWA